MRIISDIHASRVPLGAFLGIGVFWGAFAAMLPQLKARLEIADGALGWVLFCAATGALLSMALAPRIDAALPRLGLFAAGISTGLAILTLGFAPSVWVFALCMVAIGVTNGLYDILGNAYCSRQEARHDRSLMNLNHGAFSVAYAISAFSTGMAREAGVAPELWFLAIGVTSLLLTGLTYSARPPAGSPPEPAQVSRGKTPGFVILAGLVTLAAFFSENSTEGWSALHIERTLGGGAAEGALGPTMLGLTMAAGRLMGHFVTVRGGEIRLIFWASLLAAAGLLLAAMAPVPLVAYLGFGLFGLGVSVIGPMAIALAGQMAGTEIRTLAVSRAAMIGYFGFFIGPPLMGFTSEAFGLRVAFTVCGAFILMVPLVLLPRLARIAPKEGVDAP